MLRNWKLISRPGSNNELEARAKCSHSHCNLVRGACILYPMAKEKPCSESMNEITINDAGFDYCMCSVSVYCMNINLIRAVKRRKSRRYTLLAGVVILSYLSHNFSVRIPINQL
jgi:hypothetical protein